MQMMNLRIEHNLLKEVTKENQLVCVENEKNLKTLTVR